MFIKKVKTLIKVAICFPSTKSQIMKADTKDIGEVIGMVLVDMVITRSLKTVNLVMARWISTSSSFDPEV